MEQQQELSINNSEVALNMDGISITPPLMVYACFKIHAPTMPISHHLPLIKIRTNF